MSSPRILILSPHPVDEVVGAATAIRRAVASGASICVLYLTTGIPAREALWPWRRGGHAARIAQRREEALAAAKLMGVTPSGFLDWPARSLRLHLGDALAAIERAIGEHGIEALWVPAWEGAHQDHDAANFLASYFRARLTVLEFAEYNFAGGTLRAGAFPDEGEAAGILESTTEEIAWKRRLLDVYVSERGNLGHVGVGREAFRPLGERDYGRPPHAGRLFWERFHWVPFRHPRVDFTKPAELRSALKQFVRENPRRSR